MVIGANDIVNPAAQDDPSSPIAGMPVLEVEGQAVHRDEALHGLGLCGCGQPAVLQDNNRMLFGDAKKMLDEVLTALKS